MSHSTAEMLLDLRLTIPGLDAQLLPEDTSVFPGSKLFFQHQALFADELPVYIFGEFIGYNHGLHQGFVTWLNRRGWIVVPFGGIAPKFLEWVGMSADVTLTGAVHLLMPEETAAAGDTDGRICELQRIAPGDHSPEMLARVKRHKRQLNQALKRGELPESTREVMKAVAELNPELFGEWRDL